MNADEIVKALQERFDKITGAYEVMSALAEVRKEEIESLQAKLADEKITSQSLRNAANGYKAQLAAEKRRADAAVECIEKIDDWNNHFCYHDLEEIIDEWRGVKEERE